VWCRTLILSLFALVSFHFPLPAQVIQTWTQKSIAGDTSTAGESSGAVGMDDNYMFVVDNEHENLRLFARYPGTSCPDPVYTFNARPNLALSSTNPEDDLESCVKAPGTNVIYWLGSHSNSKSGGNLRTNRNRIFATTVSGNGTGSPPYSLAYRGRYDNLRTDLINWDKNNLHGKGANYYGLEASAADGVASEAVNGFNIEGLCFAPDGTNTYIAFRVPLVNASGATTSSGQRTNALIVPLINISDLVTNSPVPGTGKAKFGTPFTLNLGKRGIRSIDSSYPGNYLILAGPPADASSPPVSPLNFRLYTWTGNPSNAPIEHFTTFPDGYGPEGAVLPATPIATNTVVQFVSDDSDACWRSFTAYAGVANVPELQFLLAPSNSVARLNLMLQPTQTVVVEYSTNLSNWTTLKNVTSTNPVTPFTDSGASNNTRYYRARF
jgi:hypothetical protein